MANEGLFEESYIQATAFPPRDPIGHLVESTSGSGDPPYLDAVIAQQAGGGVYSDLPITPSSISGLSEQILSNPGGEPNIAGTYTAETGYVSTEDAKAAQREQEYQDRVQASRQGDRLSDVRSLKRRS